MVGTGMLIAKVWVNVPDGMSSLIEGSLSPEVEHPTSERSRVKVSAVEGRVVISLEASDVVALRAALNSYLRWVGTILDVVDVVS
ncbi:MAG: KEOPS complex subunit Pcc1 [Candidatus Bathyarchaeota archaeon]|jgi:tRNA threonylcarbamoyladenosine modification (KEOPS) complex  Pcc1 subunit|nr:KEOPS complex subunit Pcc1 [Candidatus Bathyarchaeota archaeon]